MKSGNAAILTSPTRCTGWRVQLADGTVKGYTDSNADFVLNDTVFPNLGFPSVNVTYATATGFSRSAVANSVGLNVDNLEIDGPLSSAGILAADVRAGRYDMAGIIAFLCDWNNLGNGVIVLRRGFVGEMTPIDSGIKVELLGLLQLLSRSFVDVTSPDCSADFCDKNAANKCKLDPATFSETGTVTSLVDPFREFNATISGSHPAGFFDAGGLVTWVTGNNAGLLSNEVKSQTGTDVVLMFPTAYAVQVGDTFSILGACDKTMLGANGCSSKSNVVNFRGFPFNPGFDAMLSGQGVG
jgi:uncharacterized phage protein (TIGR02218 family)